MIDTAQRPEYFEFANILLRADFEPIKSRCIANLGSDGTILGVVVFDRFSRWNVELNVASVSPTFLSRQLIKATFNYIFNKCGMIRVTTVTNEDNVKSLKMQDGLGFVREATLRNAYGEKDGIVMRMLRHECRWL